MRSMRSVSFCSPANAVSLFSNYLPPNAYLQRVIEVSKRYLPQTAVGFSSPKVKVHIQDGAEFMQQCAGQFDVIITDSSDPIGEDSNIQYIYGYSQRELQRSLMHYSTNRRL